MDEVFEGAMPLAGSPTLTDAEKTQIYNWASCDTPHRDFKPKPSRLPPKAPLPRNAVDLQQSGLLRGRRFAQEWSGVVRMAQSWPKIEARSWLAGAQEGVLFSLVLLAGRQLGPEIFGRDSTFDRGGLTRRQRGGGDGVGLGVTAGLQRL
jgi:hypothetical protein